MQFLRKTLWLCALGTALCPLLAGCGGGGGGDNGSSSTPPPTNIPVPTPTPTPTPTPGPTLSLSANAHGLTATLAENAATVAVGGVVNYTLTLTNTTGTTATFNAPSATAPPAYLVVNDSSGKPVFNPIPPPPFNQVTLPPGQALTQTISVQTFAAPGTYNATVSFSFSDGTPATIIGPLAVTAQ